MIRRSQLIAEIKSKLTGYTHNESAAMSAAIKILADIERYLEPRVRPLTDEEVEDHVLVKQVHDSRKDEVRNYVRNLDYEWKREYLPEDK